MFNFSIECSLGKISYHMDPTGKIIYFFSTAKPSACKEAVDSLEFVSLAEQDSDTSPVQILMNKDASLGYLFYLWEP